MGDWRDHDQVQASMTAYMDIIKDYSQTWKLPVMIGEFCCWEFTDVWEWWTGEMNQAGIHWAHWSYKVTDPERRDNWSLFYDFQGEYIDYRNEDLETIRKKWSQYGSENYRKNEVLERILRKSLRYT